MNDQLTQLANSQRVMTIQIIAGALIVGVIVSGIVITVIGMSNKPSDPLVGYLALGMGVMSIVLSGILPELITKVAVAKLGSSTEGSAEDLFPIFQTKTIVGLALLEGAAMFCLIAYIITAQWWTLAGAAFLLAVMAVNFPTRNKIENWMRVQIENLEFNVPS